MKDALSSPKTLAYFDGNAQTKVIADAGPVGLGGILVQEQNGEQRPRSKPSARIERWMLRLQAYQYRVKYKPGKANVSDCLSRLITDNSKNSEISDFNERYINFVTKTAVPVAMTAAEIEAESEKDQEITNLRVCIRSSDWGRCKYPKYVFAKDELCEFNNTVLRGTRIVVPYKLRQRVIQLAHEGHQGIVKTKHRLRTKVWWPSMEKDAEKFCRLCRECQRVGLPDPPEEMRRTELPKGPWQDLAADLMGPLPNGEYVLVIVDYFSRYFEVNFIRRVTSTVIVRCLEKMFTTHGLPYSIKTDNGRQFVSEELETFLEEHGIEHRTSTPYWPQANGEVERQNRTLLKTLKIAHAQKLNIHHELNKFLIAYRSTPHCITGETPAKLLFGREIRTKLPDIQATSSNIEDVRDRDYQLKLKGKVYADAKRQAKQSNINKGDLFILKQDRENKLSETFSTNQYKVIEKKGNELTVQGEDGEVYRRNTSFVKPVIPADESDSHNMEIETDIPTPPSPQKSRPVELSQTHEAKKIARKIQRLCDDMIYNFNNNQYIQLVKVLYCKLPSNGKQLQAFPLEVGPGTELGSQRWERRVSRYT